MGRSSGGGSHSSGGFGGGHSSGGFSGGGRSSSGGFSHSSGTSGFSHSGGGRPPHHHSNNFYYFGGGPRPPGGPGILTYLIVFIIIIFVLMSISSNSSVQKSTKERTALSGVVNKTDWYDDELGWITNKNKLISGLEDFYKQTGIQPYVLFVSYSSDYWNGTNFNSNNADKYLESVYSSRFNDEAHFIFAYFECKNDSKSEMDGEFRYLSGYSADTIMDTEAIDILWGYFEKNYYNTSLSIEEMISNTFSETAKSIMSKPTNGWDFAKVLVITVGIIIAIAIIYSILKNKHKREKEKEKYTEEILSKPLETFGSDTSNLEKKYEDKK